MKKSPVRMLAEGGVSIALALVLSYLKIPVASLGGSIDFVMVPLIVFAYRWGLWQGLLAGLAFGTLKFFLAGGAAVNWQSMLLDYSVAYAFVGFAGLIRKKKNLLPVSALIGCFARYLVHVASGVTIYKDYAESAADFFGLSVATPNVILYSLVYNAAYMLPNTIIAIVVCAILIKPVELLDRF
ncbi:MAG: energy-coupled thiamine transporter ThiT [Clostridia bacterium]|nr:energy-coupled thiamine transporter ThiT [Clostridia bacterium]